VNVQHSLPGPRSINISARGEERHAELADLDLSSIVQQSLVNEDAIKVRAIKRAHVFNLKSCAVANKLGVTTRHGHVIKEDVSFGVTTGDGGILIKEEPSAGVGALANDEES
jgi:hypothetical protein